MVLAKESTSSFVHPNRIRVPPPAAPPRSEFITTHPSAPVSSSFAAAELYQIQAIPATYLIDPDGKIIAKDLRGPSLEAKLAELFD
jgi:hypothetical protein